MKILFVAPWIPGVVRPRSLALLRLLAAEHHVRFVGLYRNEAERAVAEALPVTDTAENVLVHNGWLGSMVRSASALATGRSLQSGYAGVPQFHRAMNRTIDEWKPDVVHCNVFRTAHLAEQLASRTRTVIDLDEFRSEYYHQLTDSASLPWRTLGRVEAPRMQRGEASLLASNCQIIVSGPSPQLEAANVHLVRTPVEFSLPRQRTPSARPTVLFAGRMNYEANEAALMWFARLCWPGILASHPDAVLQVVGASPSRTVRALAGPSIEVLADVPSMTPYYAAASCAIVPIIRGTGVQMKLIQALLTGVPTVTTPHAAALAGVSDGAEVRCAEDAASWVDVVAELLANSEDARLLANRGQRWAGAHHSMSAVAAQLESVYAPWRRAERRPGGLVPTAG